MKKTSFVIGLIGGILGILSNAYLLITFLNMKAVGMFGSLVQGVSILGILLSVVAIVGICMERKIKNLSGILIFLGAISNLSSSLFSISIDCTITLILCAVAGILLLITGKIKLSIQSN